MSELKQQTFTRIDGTTFTEDELKKECDIFKTLFMESVTTNRPTKTQAKKIMEKFYKLILNKPFPEKEFHLFESPFKAWKWIQENKCENPKQEYISPNAIDVRSAGYYNFYAFAVKNKLVKCEKELEEKIDMALDMLQFSKVFPFDDCCIVSLNPIRMEFKGEVLHCEKDMSVEFSDGTGFYSLTGVKVPEYVVRTEAKNFSKEVILGEKNADVRREILRKIGSETMLEIFDSETVDVKDDYKLVKIVIEDIKRNYLVMKNPSIDALHIEGVPNECNSVNAALAWRNGMSEYVKPMSLT